MVIKGIDNQMIKLEISNYEFPHLKGNKYDKNWLIISVNVKSKLGDWKANDSALLTWEMKEIIDWFSKLSTNSTKKTYLAFIEPCLSFFLLNEYDSDLKRIKIKFDYEFKPNSAKKDEEYFIEFEVNKDGLVRIANELQAELDKYPRR